MRGFSLFVLLLFVYLPIASQVGAIHDAAKKRDVVAITAALNAGAGVNESDGYATPLFFAIKRGHIAAAK
jgi:cytochrome c